mgnify:CR=1 FL=1
MSMSWQNTPGPFGKYPCEEGYDDDLVEYSLRSFEHGMNNWKRKILNFIKQQESTQPLIFPWIVIKDRLFKYSGTGEYLSDKYDLPLLYIDSDSKIVQQTFLGETTNKLNVITTNLCVVIDPDNPRYVILFIDDEHDYNDVINPILQNCKFVNPGVNSFWPDQVHIDRLSSISLIVIVLPIEFSIIPSRLYGVLS